MMVPIKVKVIGPGECIGNEMNIIEKALKDAGYPVEVIDEYPPKNKDTKRANAGWKIILEAQHCPWGG